MDEQKTHHKMVVGSFIKNKLQEYEYFLQKVADICTLTHKNFLSGVCPANSGQEDVNFIFNALVNTFQSLKDSLATATGEPLVWSRFADVRHFHFFKECRNAVTHDGMQIIDGWADGRYFVASDVERFDNRGRLISIEAPKDDVLTLCLEFSTDFMVEIDKIAVELGQNIPTQSHVDKMNYIESCMSNSFVPDFARDLFKQSRDDIAQQLKAHKHHFDPVGDIQAQAGRISSLCESYLAER
ncbi:hypothetical protein D5687_01935 [Guyparkeria sp. SCN-R1]|uniref:hypothetical protein n=1 Tax=Guyparkeria sp. SCN-R1 TaxID=2341113 RepID=UPI000F647F10|nr:hypothetical protein [Guyparkeria sp. SCN-R1]RRQ24522.1 hypothetical protein D5687_01935 [Guyparkeria sp. SCN-R1]